jgi:hypothetical protein
MPQKVIGLLLSVTQKLLPISKTIFGTVPISDLEPDPDPNKTDTVPVIPDPETDVGSPQIGIHDSA